MGLVLGQFGPGSAWQRRMIPNKTPNKMSPRGMRSRDPDPIRIVNGSDYWFSNTQFQTETKESIMMMMMESTWWAGVSIGEDGGDHHQWRRVESVGGFRRVNRE
ncbi:hypothetical protein PanWU01x14_049870 [Parasponia andersonii]|uniref:Uncharacterized protein n=1 Tax=Parasponia andersonii TaxID=3476 RepID=A0A2P5DMR9_PARAD|nr:hypothetical protein PanWU01x14_049870 [Parasponia andersonii]